MSATLTPDQWSTMWQAYLQRRVGYTERQLENAGRKNDHKKVEEYMRSAIEGSRKDSAVFAAFQIRDPKGRMIRMAAIHYIIHKHIDWCKANNVYAGILAPFGHGKTEHFMSRMIWEIGQNPHIRAKLVCNIDDNAKQRMQAIKRVCSENQWAVATFPHIAEHAEATRHRMRLTAQRFSKDATLESWGILGSGIGSRADLLMFDDPVDEKSLTSKAKRDDTIQKFYNTWMSRLVPDGFAMYIATAWHNHDLTASLQSNNEWAFVIMAISQDFQRIDCKLTRAGVVLDEFTIPLWEDYWSMRRLKAEATSNEHGARAFERGFRQRPMTAEDAVFTLEKFKYFDRRSWNPAERTITHPETGDTVQLKVFQACDLAISQKERADFFAHGTIGVADNGDAFLLNIWRARLTFPAQRDAVIMEYERWDPITVGIESVAYQDALRQAVLEVARIPLKKLIPVKDKRTRAMKAAIQVDNGKVYLPGIMRNGRWEADEVAVPGIRHFTNEVAIFQGQGDEHDDLVDTFCYLLMLSHGNYVPKVLSIRL